jgi:hypothetical protein
MRKRTSDSIFNPATACAAWRTCTKQRLAKRYGPLPVPVVLMKAAYPDANAHT